MAATGDGLESKDLQTMISDCNETAEMMVKRVWPRVDSWKVQWSKKLRASLTGTRQAIRANGS